MIDWRTATHRDKSLLRSFQCADPAGGHYDRLRKIKSHTEPWAEQVQKGLRTWRYRIAGSELWLGFEGDELVAAGAYAQTYEGTEPVDAFQIAYVACAFEWRGQHLGDQCLGQVLADISQRTDYRDGVVLTADVHERNRPSQKLFERFGFARDEVFTASIREGSGKHRASGQYGVWVGQL